MAEDNKYDSVIESINIIIKNMEENKSDCVYALEHKVKGLFPLDPDGLKGMICDFEKDIELHKEAIIALKMVASGKLRVI